MVVTYLCPRLSRWLSGKEPACHCKSQATQVGSLVRKIPWRRKRKPSIVFLPGKFHGQRSLAGYNPGGLQRVRHNQATEHTQEVPGSAICKMEMWGGQRCNSAQVWRPEVQGCWWYKLQVKGPRLKGPMVWSPRLNSKAKNQEQQECQCLRAEGCLSSGRANPRLLHHLF